jgi:short-subunit dehydrogenase
MTKQGKIRVFITGGSKGIGKALTLEYAKQDAEIFLFSRNETALEGLTEFINENGGKAHFYAGDVTNKSDVAAAIEKAGSEMNGIDIAILNAGISEHINIREFDSRIYEKTFAVNLIGNTYIMEYVIPVMKRQKSGKIVGISSIAGFRATPGSSAYSASKIAFDYLLESARYELKDFGIAVITVRFGFINTEIIKKNDFYMPFMLEPEECAIKVIKGIEAGKSKIQFPLIMLWLSKIASVLPEMIYGKIMKFRIK